MEPLVPLVLSLFFIIISLKHFHTAWGVTMTTSLGVYIQTSSLPQFNFMRPLQ